MILKMRNMLIRVQIPQPTVDLIFSWSMWADQLRIAVCGDICLLGLNSCLLISIVFNDLTLLFIMSMISWFSSTFREFSLFCGSQFTELQE